MTEFTGFPPALFEFFEKLEKDNSKSFWSAHKSEWDNDVRRPMLAFLEEIEPEFGSMRVFRPNRDLRFSKDKSPYKLWIGATSESQAIGGIGYYIEINARQMTIGYGAMKFDRDQLHRFRDAIINEASGKGFAAVCQSLEDAELPVTSGIEPPLKRIPAGLPSDHERTEFLLWRGVGVVQAWDKAPWMHTRDVLDRSCVVWHEAAPLKAWLESYVGTPGS